MQPNVLTAFIGNRQDKIKVFPTTKKVKPFSLNGKFVRRAFPFLMASAMVFTACSDDKSPQPKDNPTEINEKPDSVAKTHSLPNFSNQQIPYTMPEKYWLKIFQEVTEKYHLTSLQGKEPLSLSTIHLLMATPEVETTDLNYNHMPADVHNFWSMVRAGISVAKKMQNNPEMDAETKQKYLDKCIEALSKISKVKGSVDEVDLRDYNNLHAFGTFERIVKYQDDADMIFYQAPGWIDEQNEFFGRYYQDHLDFEKKAQQYPGIEMFAKALYANSERLIIEAQDSVYANALSNKMFEEWRHEQGISEPNICAYADVEQSFYVNTTVYNNKRGYMLGINLDIDPTGKIETDEGIKYLPVGCIKIHEMQHILALAAKSYEKPDHNYLQSEKNEPDDLQGLNDNYVELGPTLYTLTLSDRIYKAMHKIDRDAEVDYGVNIQVSNNSIPLGKIANWFGQMLEKHPSKSIDKVLQEKEVMEQINTWGLDKHELPLMMANNLEVSR